MKLSVIIPTLNEQSQIMDTLVSLKSLPYVSEIIVVDGGSNDNTLTIAAQFANVIRSKPGRALQMNAGAHEATGDILLFLHADSLLPTSGPDVILKAFDKAGVVAGGFRVRFDDSSLIFKIIALGSNLRAKYLKIFFGDQGIFVRKDVFLKVGGFPEIPIMEDWGLCRLLKAKGKLVQVPVAILTSSRRFHKHGIYKTLLLMHKLKLLYLLGVSPTILRRMYPSHNES